MNARTQHKPRRGRPPGRGNAWRVIDGRRYTVDDIARRLDVAPLTARKYYAAAAGVVTWKTLTAIRDASAAANDEPSERARMAARLRRLGFTWKEVGETLGGITPQRAQQLGARGNNAQ